MRLVELIILPLVLLEVLLLRTRLHLQITQALIRIIRTLQGLLTLVTVRIHHMLASLQIVLALQITQVHILMTQALLIVPIPVTVRIHRTRVPLQIAQPTVQLEVRIRHTRVTLRITQARIRIIHQVLIARTLLIVLIPRGIQILRTRLPLLIIQDRQQIIQILVTRLPLLIIQVLTQIIQILRITQRLQIRLLEQTIPRIILTLVS